MSIIKKHARKPPQEPDKDEISRKAYSHVTTQESFLESIFTSMFSKDKREAETWGTRDMGDEGHAGHGGRGMGDA